MIWETEHSVETIASPKFAWAHMTDVSHWNDPPAQFRFDGPFVTGGYGTTETPGQAAQSWRPLDVQPIESHRIEFALDQASLSFVWRFRGLPDGHTCLTQHITLEGEKARAYLAEVQQAFASNLAMGMKRIAAMLDRAYAARWQEQGKSDAGVASADRPS